MVVCAQLCPAPLHDLLVQLRRPRVLLGNPHLDRAIVDLPLQLVLRPALRLSFDAQGMQRARKVVHAGQRVEVVVAELLFAHLQHLLKRGSGPFVIMPRHHHEAQVLPACRVRHACLPCGMQHAAGHKSHGVILTEHMVGYESSTSLPEPNGQTRLSDSQNRRAHYLSWHPCHWRVQSSARSTA
eukprot:366289-Chlamydomonas_euryale.AAC.5